MSDIPTLPQFRLVHTITDRFSMANTYLICEPRLVVVNPRSSLNVRLLMGYMKHVLHRPMSDIDLVVLTFVHPDYNAGIEALRRICPAPVAASNALRAYSSLSFRHDYDSLIDLWLDDAESLPLHPAWHVLAYPGFHPNEKAESLFLYNSETHELLCGDLVTVFEGNPILRYDVGTNRRQLEEILKLVRSLDVSYLYPIRGRQLLRHAPFAQVHIA